ncbi:MAG: acylneuraminate cytidylyltransferase family protein [Limnobacter sp.]|nr:acylneuraminate cytidylyltransferase family protein [Limnobacter sp.]
MNEPTVLAVITARGGSKGLPRKNVLPAAGKPLIVWTVEAAFASTVINRVILSSDDDEIMEVAAAAGCDIPFRRPTDLASDKASSMDVVFHALQELPGYDFVVLLQPTSPLRTAEDIDEAFHLMQAHNAPACVSVTEVEQSPYWMYKLTDDDRLTGLLEPLSGVSRRQDLPSVYTLNGAIYIANVEWLLKSGSFIGPETVAYKMPKSRSIDIDDDIDFRRFCQKVESSHFHSTK